MCVCVCGGGGGGGGGGIILIMLPDTNAQAMCIYCWQRDRLSLGDTCRWSLTYIVLDSIGTPYKMYLATTNEKH